ncbi:MAG: 30S ribosomal protein S1 [Proteobacteria bacterium]|nr:30S ribosomal protein S1 [Pseudomonadota bacterium]
MTNQTSSSTPLETESFTELLESFLGSPQDSLEGRVVKGTIMAFEKDLVIIDIGLKSEGRIPLKEFKSSTDDTELKIGDLVDVYIEKLEDKNGEIFLSRERARREAVWGQLEEAHTKGERVLGVIYSRVKGGFTVDLGGAVAFLPGSQVDVRPIRDTAPLMGVPQPFMILKMDRARGNIVVSRRSILEESREEARSELVSNLEEGQIVSGVVKNITDYGAFVDLGGIDGLLHVTDISWKRITHPSEVLNIGQTIQVQITKFNKDTNRISLGMKQLESDPWAGIEAKYPIGALLHGRITNITDYGAFVELEAGVEGLVHVSEMSWTKKNFHPSKLVSTSQEVDVKVLDVDPSKRRISLGIKQCQVNPWAAFSEAHKVGDIIEGEIKNITDFGLFVGLNNEIDGMVHSSDISWEKSGDESLKSFKKGQIVQVKVLDIDVEKERVGLGMKQLSEDPFEGAFTKLKQGQVVTCTVTQIQDNGIDVKIGDEVPGFIKKNELSRDRNEQRSDRFAVGEKLDAVITSIDRKSRSIVLSVKAYEVNEEKRVMAEFGSSDSGASLGDILGAAMSKAKTKEAAEDKKPKADAKSEKASKAKEPKAAKEKEPKAPKETKAKEPKKAKVEKEPKADESSEA